MSSCAQVRWRVVQRRVSNSSRPHRRCCEHRKAVELEVEKAEGGGDCAESSPQVRACPCVVFITTLSRPSGVGKVEEKREKKQEGRPNTVPARGEGEEEVVEGVTEAGACC